MRDSLDKLTIKGFKSIPALVDFELTNLNILIGSNGAGKSNFIEFFRLLRTVFENKLDEFIRNGGGISDFLFNGRKVTKQLEFEMLFGKRGYRFNIVPTVKEQCTISTEARYFKGESTFERLCEKDFNVWLEDYSVGELWTKNVISGGISHE